MRAYISMESHTKGERERQLDLSLDLATYG